MGGELTRSRFYWAAPAPRGVLSALSRSGGQLADKVGTDARQVSRYNSGRITPSLDVLPRLAEVLDVRIDYLAFDEVAPTARASCRERPRAA